MQIWKLICWKPLSVVKKIGQRFVIKGTLNRKVCSVRSRSFTIKHDHRLKMTVLKSIRKCLLSTPKIQSSKKTERQNAEDWKKWNYYQNYVEEMFSVVNKHFPLRQSFYGPLLLWKSSGNKNELSCSITNLCPIIFIADRATFTFFQTIICKIGIKISYLFTSDDIYEKSCFV